MQAKKYIICGVPRAGKSTLARAIARKIGCSHLPLDPLMSAFSVLYPESGIKLTMDCDDTSYFATIKKATMFWCKYIEGLDKEFDRYVVEGFHMYLPYIYEKFSKTHTIVVVGYTHIDQKIDAIKTYDTATSWTSGLGHNLLVENVSRFVHLAKEYRQMAEQYQVEFLDTSNDFSGVLRRYVDTMSI